MVFRAVFTSDQWISLSTSFLLCARVNFSGEAEHYTLRFYIRIVLLNLVFRAMKVVYLRKDKNEIGKSLRTVSFY